MKDNSVSTKFQNITLWDSPEESTYYDRQTDLQGEVPGASLEEAKEAYEKKYGIKL